MGEPVPIAVLVRIWLPDRPGALGLVASRIGALRGDIIGVDVLERDQGQAVDEVAVVLPDRDLLEMLVDEIEQVDGVSVEEVRVVGAFPDPRLDALAGAALLVEAVDVTELHQTLVDHLHRELVADWNALTARELLACVADAPGADVLDALVAQHAAPTRGVGSPIDPENVALATLPVHGATVLVGRSGDPFRRLERAQLSAMARVADRAWTLLDPVLRSRD